MSDYAILTRLRWHGTLGATLADHPGPNWFASVMGTGIVANAAALLPVQSPALHDAALGMWILAASMLILLLVATATHWHIDRERARAHHLDPRMAPFYGAPPMAMLTVGAGALLVGRDVIGLAAAVRVAEVLWAVGTATGLVSAVFIPYLMFTRHRLQLADTLGSWLMPVVPPMVSAATGAALISHLPAAATASRCCSRASRCSASRCSPR